MSKVLIKPAKLVQKMDQVEATAVWATISQAADEIYRKNSSALSYELLYRHAYNLILAKHGDFLYAKTREKITEHLTTALSTLKTCLTENLLANLAEKWEHHKLSVSMVKDILMYMDSQYAVQQKKLPVFGLGLTLFRDVIIYSPDVRQRLQTILIMNINDERKGNLVDQNLLRINLSMLSDLNIDGVNVYEDEFETPFLNDTRSYYKEESLRYMSDCTIPEYLTKAQDKLNEESKRVVDYLSKTSESKLMSLMEYEMLQYHCKSILDSDRCGVVQLYTEDRHSDLQRMCVALHI